MEDPDRERRFLALLNANLPALGRLAGSYAGSTGEREDLLQEIALALWQALPRFRGESSERTFLFRIAHNHCIDHITRRRPMASLQELELDPEDGARSVESTLTQEQESARLMAAVRRLPLIQRQVVILALVRTFDGQVTPRRMGATITRRDGRWFLADLRGLAGDGP